MMNKFGVQLNIYRYIKKYMGTTWTITEHTKRHHFWFALII